MLPRFIQKMRKNVNWPQSLSLVKITKLRHQDCLRCGSVSKKPVSRELDAFVIGQYSRKPSICEYLVVISHANVEGKYRDDRTSKKVQARRH